MRNLTYCILGLLLFIGCNSTPLKEYSDNDVEYNEKTNTWIQKSDGSIIKESFVINDELFDGVNPHRREVKIDENGHVITSTLYRGNTLLQKGDFSKAPHEIWVTQTASHPDNTSGETIIMQQLLKPDGKLIYYMKSNKQRVAEVLYDKDGNPVKSYEWYNGKRVVHMADLFPAESIAAGYSWSTGGYHLLPGITFKLRNKSGHSITDNLRVYYKFIRDDEIVESDYTYVTADGGWDNNLLKPVKIIGWKVNDIDKIKYPHPKDFGLRARITFEDGSVVYDDVIPFQSIDLN